MLSIGKRAAARRQDGDEAVAGQPDRRTESAGRVGPGRRWQSPDFTGSKIIRHQAALVLSKSGRSRHGRPSCNTSASAPPASEITFLKILLKMLIHPIRLAGKYDVWVVEKFPHYLRYLRIFLMN
jgi:hypothetical protein